MGPSTRVQCRCGKCSKALSGFQYQTQDVKTKHEKKYPLVSLSVPKHVSSVMPANSPGVEDGVDGPKRQQQDLDHNRRGASPVGTDRRAGAELEEVRDISLMHNVGWDLIQTNTLSNIVFVLPVGSTTCQDRWKIWTHLTAMQYPTVMESSIPSLGCATQENLNAHQNTPSIVNNWESLAVVYVPWLCKDDTR